MRTPTLCLVTIALALGFLLAACGTQGPSAVLEPTAAPAPTPVTVRLLPDGSGDYPSLEAAVDDVSEGSTIALEPGTYLLAEPLEIGKAINLVGANMDQTVIACAGEEYVVQFSGAGPFAAQEITFSHQGGTEANVVVVESGQVDFRRCRFTGAVWTEEAQARAGLRLEGGTRGVVRKCMAVDNNGHGIRVVDRAQPTLERNVCSDNSYNGIVYRDSGGGVAWENECYRNGLHGIDVYDNAQPILERNTCTANQESGVAYFGQAGGVARQNDCSTNGLHGISLQGQARPTLEENVCADNQESGIAYFEQADGAARRNECSGNGTNGITVQNEAHPALEGNHCFENALNGIALLDGVQPKLEGNQCVANGQDGIMYASSAGGMALGNTCSENGLHGIEVQAQARPMLQANLCTDNAQAGIGYSAKAGGVAFRNQCSGNRWGIYVAETADPELKENECHDNAHEDILDLRPTAPVAHSPRRATP